MLTTVFLKVFTKYLISIYDYLFSFLWSGSILDMLLFLSQILNTYVKIHQIFLKKKITSSISCQNDDNTLISLNTVPLLSTTEDTVFVYRFSYSNDVIRKFFHYIWISFWTMNFIKELQGIIKTVWHRKF